MEEEEVLLFLFGRDSFDGLLFGFVEGVAEDAGDEAEAADNAECFWVHVN